jgi:hypothetical protein
MLILDAHRCLPCMKLTRATSEKDYSSTAATNLTVWRPLLLVVTSSLMEPMSALTVLISASFPL